MSCVRKRNSIAPMRSRLLILVLVLSAAHTQAVDFPVVRAGVALHFPRDHGAHPDFRSEWWYVTAWVKDEAGEEFGIQLTFFRSRTGLQENNPALLAPRQLLLAHVAIANARQGRLLREQRVARLLPDVVFAKEADTDLRIRDWRLAREGKRYVSSGHAREFSWRLTLAPTQPLLLHGSAGYSRKGARPAQASYYYSQPQLRISGQVQVLGKMREVSGVAWLDHEWSSEFLAEDVVGWDWAGINFDDGRALMAFRMRDATGNALWSGGSLRDADGRTARLAGGEVQWKPVRTWRSPRSAIIFPVAMSLRVRGLQFELLPLMDDQELDARASTGNIYWEGAVRAEQNERIIGRGYLELTGYGAPLRF